ncbi:MAG: DNA helicase RecG, partial [Anaerolineae bacterium]|nr:DNA helicase RecG [Anaerolineae bacterium]
MNTENVLTRLLKILALEKKQGYRNKAVIGGLDKFVSRWETDARAEFGHAEAISQIVALLLGYAVIEDPAARERIIEEVERRARDLSSGPAPAGEPAPTPAPAPAPTPAPVPPPATAEAAPRLGPSAAEEKPRPREPFGPAPSKPVSMPPGEPPSVPPPAELPAPEPETMARPARAPRPTAPGTGLDAPVTRLPGVGPGFAQKLNKLGVRTVRDLLYLLPRRYEDYSNLRTIAQLRWGEEVTVIGTVWEVKSRPIGEERRLVTARVGDGTGEMEMTWFAPFVERQLHIGHAYAFSGKVDSYRGVPTMRHPAFEPLDREQVSTGRLVPVYPLTEGLSAPWLRRVMDRAVKTWAAEIPDFLPEAVRREYQLLPLAQALTQIHFPDSREMLAAAHRRLSFDEFFLLQLGFLSARQQFRGTPAAPLPADPATEAAFLAALPFPLTHAQRRALAQIAEDLRKDKPMSRLLQGDVGSGKPAVAAAALWFAVADGKQGAIM